MAEPSQRALLAGFLSMLLPGAGQLFRGARRRGLLLLGVTALILLVLPAAVAWRGQEGLPVLDRRLVATLLIVDLGILAFRVFAVVDAARGVRTVLARAMLVGLVVATALPHAAAGYVTVRSYDVLETVFAKEEPNDVLPSQGLFVSALARPPERYPGIAAPPSAPRPVAVAGPRYDLPLGGSSRVLGRQPVQGKPWTTILLLGTDEGPGNSGARTDTMILAAIQHGTGHAVAFGIPRNLVEVPLGGALPGKPKRFEQPLNALYGYARASRYLPRRTRSRGNGAQAGGLEPARRPGRLLRARQPARLRRSRRRARRRADPRQGAARRRGDAAGVGRAEAADRRPARPPLPLLRPGGARLRALRKDSNDYTRMARQRCFLSAMADQLDPVRVLRNFPGLARTVERNVATDVPLRRLPALIRLVGGIDPKETLTETFGADYVASRRKLDNYPLPKMGLMRQTVREAILFPERASADRGLASAGKSC